MKKFIIGIIVVVILAVFGWVAFMAVQQPKSQVNQQSDNRPPQSGQQTPAPPAPTHIEAVLKNMSLSDKVASLLVAYTPGTDPQALGKFMDTYHLGGFIMMGDNMPRTDAALQAETAALRGSDKDLPRLVATDEEGGTVKRLPGDNYASALTLKNLPATATSQAFTSRSQMVQSVGITLNFGIIADTTADPNSFIFPRVLGTTPGAAADRVAAAVAATKGKTLSTLKHFPGHGETEADSHVSIPTTPLSFTNWQKRDEPPFLAGVKAGVDVVMMGHLRYSAVDSKPASLSKKWHDILRQQLGFNGVIITDAMGMLEASGEPAYADPVTNAVMALTAGNTMLLYVSEGSADNPKTIIDGIVAAVKDGKISEQTIDQDAQKALELRSKTAAFVRG